MTLRELLQDLARRLNAAGVASPRVDAELLVRHALQLDRTGLLLQAERQLGGAEVRAVELLAARRAAREPLQHILGAAPFADLTLRITPAALIPRPETEVLLHLALRALRDVSAPRVLDVGTGSGALALAVKHARPDARVYATDLSGDALELARENAARLQLEVHFVQGDLHGGLGGPFELIVSNPPYLPAVDEHVAQPEVRFDPPLALYAGPDGLAVARRLLRVAGERLAPAGVLALELDPRNVRVLAGELPPGWQATVESDLSGRERFLLVRPDAGT